MAEALRPAIASASAMSITAMSITAMSITAMSITEVGSRPISGLDAMIPLLWVAAGGDSDIVVTKATFAFDLDFRGVQRGGAPRSDSPKV
ncbi:hypothetical protein [Frankia sp. AgKG'84/4]|uniref:hypothetical protein n=1 Tax=Frankia sp. AgKG'84/4 TaxID=573490 RepID=UPI00200C17C5|nr:hypothetical protein [Frankia sp. AgKG'84/4]MCL9798313.1 hypothetical protein [Frankia sp. AgKG'84/4]